MIVLFCCLGPGKRDSSPHIVDDDSSSDNFPDEHGSRRRFAGKPGYSYSPRRPRSTSAGRRAEPLGESPAQQQQQQPLVERRRQPPPHVPPRGGSTTVCSELGLPHPTKEEMSKSEESSSSPTEEGKDQAAGFPGDTEYGHASAPMTSGSDTDERGGSRPTPSPRPAHPHHNPRPSQGLLGANNTSNDSDDMRLSPAGGGDLVMGGGGGRRDHHAAQVSPPHPGRCPSRPCPPPTTRATPPAG